MCRSVCGVTRPASLASLTALVDGTYLYDILSKNLIIRVKVKAGDDNIINLSW